MRTGRGEACSGGERGRVEQEARGAGQARAAEEKGRRAGRAARQRRERKEEGERKRKEEKEKGKWEKEKEKEGGEREERALAGGIRGGRCDSVGHAQRCVRARMRPQEKYRGRESDVRNRERDSGKRGSGFKSILSTKIRSFASNYFSV